MKTGLRTGLWLVATVIAGFGAGCAMTVQREAVKDAEQGSIEVKKEARTLACAETNHAVSIEMATKVAVVQTAGTDFEGSALDKAYADCLSEFLQQYNKAFEACAKQKAWVVCDLVRDEKGAVTDVAFSLEQFEQKELRALLLDKLTEQLEDAKAPDVSEEKDMAAIAAAPKTSWSIFTKLSWVPLWLFRKSLMSLLTSGSIVPAGLLSLLMLACPDWILTVLGQDVLPFVAKKAAPSVAEAALTAMNFSNDQIVWLVKQLKGALGV